MEQDVTSDPTLSSYAGESLSFPSDHISIDETFVTVFPGLSAGLMGGRETPLFHTRNFLSSF